MCLCFHVLWPKDMDNNATLSLLDLNLNSREHSCLWMLMCSHLVESTQTLEANLILKYVCFVFLFDSAK